MDHGQAGVPGQELADVPGLVQHQPGHRRRGHGDLFRAGGAGVAGADRAQRAPGRAEWRRGHGGRIQPGDGVPV
ncbi:MAG: hypothetical protein M0030_08785 [Actinomycetota bacterium]|nr:hypothetical protein [Actinomycetota bacterium]